MKNRDTKKFNKALLDGADVPDSVLDRAKAEMANNLPESVSSPTPAIKTRTEATGNAVAINSKAIAVSCACAAFAVCLAVILAAVFLRSPTNSSDNSNYYCIAELDRQQISSLEQYNEQNYTQYISADIENVVTYVYTANEETVLIVQTFTYEQTEYAWYIAVNENYFFDVLSDYSQTDDAEEIGSYTIYYGFSNCYYAMFYADGSAYYLTGGTDSAAVSEILKTIIE
ncbi:MAG: hypothetical protein LUI60_04940 [Clostridia bacterium]|nr:hypothetical protein [Clostridia bacterium]